MDLAFIWDPSFSDLLNKAALEDEVKNEDWGLLRQIIRYKLSESVRLYFEGDGMAHKKVLVTDSDDGSNQPTTAGGLVLPPFKSRESVANISIDMFPSHITAEQAHDKLTDMFQLLDDFQKPPFTIQRICELCLDSRQNYTEIGKFLRALERSLLVTSSGDSFTGTHTDADSADLASASFLRDATIPLFSPITFLHEDPRSRSPSPMSIPGVHVSLEVDGSTGGDVIGLVDELDNPEPGHLADRPRSLTRITSEHDISRAGTSGLNQSDAIPISALADNQNNMTSALKTELFGFAKDEDKEVEDMVLENKGAVENQ